MLRGAALSADHQDRVGPPRAEPASPPGRAGIWHCSCPDTAAAETRKRTCRASAHCCFPLRGVCHDLTMKPMFFKNKTKIPQRSRFRNHRERRPVAESRAHGICHLSVPCASAPAALPPMALLTLLQIPCQAPGAQAASEVAASLSLRAAGPGKVGHGRREEPSMKLAPLPFKSQNRRNTRESFYSFNLRNITSFSRPVWLSG